MIDTQLKTYIVLSTDVDKALIRWRSACNVQLEQELWVIWCIALTKTSNWRSQEGCWRLSHLGISSQWEGGPSTLSPRRPWKVRAKCTPIWSAFQASWRWPLNIWRIRDRRVWPTTHFASLIVLIAIKTSRGIQAKCLIAAETLFSLKVLWEL